MKYAYIVPVKKVEHRVTRKHVRGVGEHAEFAEVPLGWFICAGHEAWGVGPERPNIRPGELLRITLEREGP